MENTNIRMLYSDKKIYAATFLGGPLVAGYMISHNYKALGKKDKVMPCWIICISFLIVLLAGLFLISDNWNVPNIIIPLAYSLVTYMLVQQLQGKEIEKFLEEGCGKLFGWWRTIGISILGCVLTFLPIFLILLAIEYHNSMGLETRIYGTIKNEITYETENISEAEVDIMSKNLTNIGFFDHDNQRSIYLKKVDEAYVLSIPVVQEYVNDSELNVELRGIKMDLETLYTNNKIIINVVVDDYKNIVRSIE